MRPSETFEIKYNEIKNKNKKSVSQDFPGGPAVKTSFPCRGYGFHPWLGVTIPPASWPGKKKYKTEAILQQIH